MPKPMSESTIASAVPYQAAIERWEGEGGRALSLEEPLNVLPGDLAPSDAKDEGSFAARSQARCARERARRSSS
jgi:hypothetical protein